MLEVSRGLVEVETPRELERLVVEPGLSVLDQLEGVRLVTAAEVYAPLIAAGLGETELDTPPGSRLVQIVDAQSDVVDPAEA
jgi:hypothetical protein